MVKSLGPGEQFPGKRVNLVCPKCGYVIANFTSDELTEETTKAKRYRALLSRQQFCGSCMCTVRNLIAVWTPQEVGEATER